MWLTFSNFVLNWDQIVECFLAFDNFALLLNQIVECSSHIRLFPSALPPDCRIAILYPTIPGPLHHTPKSPQTQKGQDFSWPHMYAFVLLRVVRDELNQFFGIFPAQAWVGDGLAEDGAVVFLTAAH